MDFSMSHAEPLPNNTLPEASSTRQDGRYRKNISPGVSVNIVQKQHQKNGKVTRGAVKELLTGSTFHPHGIKVRLEDGKVGRVKEIFSQR
jgi:uncharacterized repeat protein (TIGR03833 family)